MLFYFLMLLTISVIFWYKTGTTQYFMSSVDTDGHVPLHQHTRSFDAEYASVHFITMTS